MKQQKNLNLDLHQSFQQDLHQSPLYNDIDLSGVSNDIIFSICLELPVASLSRFRSVGKYWFDLICDPSFIKTHLDHHRNSTSPSILLSISKQHDLLLQCDTKVDDDDDVSFTTKVMATPFLSENFQIVGSCNGLICFYMNSYEPDPGFCIWNPCTAEYKRFSGAPKHGKHHHLSYGFGYDYTIDDYKVISQTYNCNGKPWSLASIEVCTLGTCSWKSITLNHQNYCYYEPHNWQKSSVYFANEALYWLVRHSESLKPIIISFDIAKEDYKEVQRPDELYDLTNGCMRLGVLKGYLCVVGREIGRECMKVWVLNKVNCSWTQLFSIENLTLEGPCQCLNPLRYCSNGEVLVATPESLVLYDPEKKKARGFTEFSKEIKDAIAYEPR